MPTQREKIIKKADVEDRIIQILYLAEVNLECSRIILDYFSKYKSDLLKYTFLLNSSKGMYLTLCSNNHFFEAVELISSLLYPYKENKTKEISFNLWARIGNIKAPDAIQNIKNNFKCQKFLELRQNVIAHKNINKAVDPDTLAILPIKKQLIDKLAKIIQGLKREALKIFKDSASNNYLFKNSDGLKIFLEKIQQELNKEITIRMNKF